MKIKSSIWTGKEHVRYAQDKLDGHFVRLFLDRMGLVHLHTATPINITHQVKRSLICNFEKLAPARTSMLGELYVPGCKASEVKKMLARNPEELRLSLFAVEYFDGHELPRDATLAYVNDLIDACGMVCAYWEPFKNAEEHLARALKCGHEGVMFKYSNLEGWYKHKPEKTIDLVVVSLNPGKGKFAGQVGALVCSTSEGHVIANCSGMSDEERTAITDLDIGRVCEVRYQYVGSQGKLRHPAFVRWRDDKSPLECSVSQDPELKAHYDSH